jgi:hypothetical protein
MSERGKNPYEQDSPEWQLWENMTSARLQSLAYARDAERYSKLSSETREKAERYEATLAKLDKA